MYKKNTIFSMFVMILISYSSFGEEFKEFRINRQLSKEDSIKSFNSNEIDLIRKSDSIIVKFTNGSINKGKNITYPSSKEISVLFTASDVTPTLGDIWATITWIADGKEQISVWVFQSGEWGVLRSGTSWTTGKNGKIAEFINQLVKNADTNHKGTDKIPPPRQ